MSYHNPVMLTECIEALKIKPDGVYVDVTFGGGGHTREILKHLGASGKLIAFDQDEDAKANLPDDPRVLFVAANFRYLSRFLKLHGYKKVDGILADLGVSSHQFDTAERGFSYRFNADLDMRMNQEDTLKASDILNTYNTGQLQTMFSEFGEVRNSKTLAQRIADERSIKPFKYISDFLTLIRPLSMGEEMRYSSQVFQALRMEVNKETDVLTEMLESTADCLKPGANLVVMSYHSIEDRLVKNVMKTGNARGEQIKDFYGNISRPFKVITKKPIEPTHSEVKMNVRARSAKLRIAERLEEKD